MSIWSTKRKLAYLSITLGTVFVFLAVPLFFIFYKQPTCFDSKKNGDETGVDCGGSCRLICASDALDPVVRWSRALKVTDNVYNAVAYIENPNVSSTIRDVSYIFRLYDKDNNLISERKGHTFVPKGKTFAIFEGGIQINGQVPTVTRFEFTSPLIWQKDISEEPEIFVRDKTLTQVDTAPRLNAFLENRSVGTISDIEVVAIIYDEDDNAIAVSRTFVDSLAEKLAPLNFTWPLPFAAKLGKCEAPVDVAIVIDRSGSMENFGKNPPQPLTDVKNAALAFVGELHQKDQAAIISFANEASTPIDLRLTSTVPTVKSVIQNISVHIDGLQNTNIADALRSASAELSSSRHQDKSNGVIVLLTDGVANRPTKTADKEYPENFAAAVASTTKGVGIQIYTIGLGKDVNTNFLQEIASAPDHYFPAPSADELSGIYKNIATAICRKGPAVIEIIPRIIPPGF